LNNYIRELVARNSNTHIINLDRLKRHNFTKHGLHLNNSGKNQVANLIISALSWKYSMRLRPNKTNKKTKQKWTTEEGTINVVATKMVEMINDFKNDSNVALAHSISVDLGHSRNMTAGVAVMFRKAFGRPKTSDYVDSKLTCESVDEGATVYSLVTKDCYNGKPTIEDYDTAFEQLTKHFKQKNLKTLICSPIGCVRDNIKPERLVANLVKFVKSTRASVVIVSYDQQAQRRLYSGLTHSEFLKKIEEEIKTNAMSIKSLNMKEKQKETQKERSTQEEDVQCSSQQTHQALDYTQTTNNAIDCSFLGNMNMFPPLI